MSKNRKGKKSGKPTIKKTISKQKVKGENQKMNIGSGNKKPEGFIEVSSSEAVMEFGTPIVEKAMEQKNDDNMDVSLLNNLMQVIMKIWNFANEVEKGNVDRKLEQDALNALKKELHLTDDEAEKLLGEMVDRKRYLIPDAIQKSGSMNLLMRKTKTYQIEAFDYDSLEYDETPVEPTEEDREIKQKLLRMDRYIKNETEYDEWEDFFIEMSEQIADAFEKWMKKKNLYNQNTEIFLFFAPMYLDNIYRYMHPELVTLKVINDFVLSFICERMIQKSIVPPQMYSRVVPSIKFFYKYLKEIGYKQGTKEIENSLDKIEPKIIELVKEQYE